VVSFTSRPLCLIGVRAAGTHSAGGWVGPRVSLDAVQERNVFALPVNLHQTVAARTDLTRYLRACIYIHTYIHTHTYSYIHGITAVVRRNSDKYLTSILIYQFLSSSYPTYVNVYAFLLIPLSFQNPAINHSIPFLSFPVQRSTHAFVSQL
jgi:hypothetical protein